MEQKLVQRASPNRWRSYGVAIVAPIAFLLVRMPFEPILHHTVPYITFFLATGISATLGGFGPGLLTTVLGAALAVYFVVEPTRTFRIKDPADVIGLVLFLIISSFISYLAGRLINARRHENALRLLFQQTLESIGDAVTLFIPLIISSGASARSQASTLVIRAMAVGELGVR